MDKKALRILDQYNLLKPEETSKEDFEYAKKQGLMFDSVEMEHDKTVTDILEEIKMADKLKATNLFLASLSTKRLEWRIGLSLYAILRVFPKHTFVVREEHEYCGVCSVFKQKKVDLSFANAIRYFCGGIIDGDLYDGCFCLKQFNQSEDAAPVQDDFRILKEILDLIKEADIKDKKNDIVKRMRTIEGFKSYEDHRRRILETFGFCSILETKDKKGLLSGFINIDTAERARHSSDWLYPVDWWQPSDGINYEALDYWFGGYPEIKEWIEQNKQRN